MGKYCAHCGTKLTRKHFPSRMEDMACFRNRKYCDMSCMGEDRTAKMVGRRFGRLVVLSQAGRSNAGYIKWLCRCDCGKLSSVDGGNLRAGKQISCGCYNNENRGKAKITHGHTSWQALRSRCFNPKNNRYAYYGARNITVCERWLNSFENFFADMGPKPGPSYSIDRIDLDGNYEPGNCRWATPVEQRRNQRRYIDAHTS
jgi:hypothetical protein